MIAHLGEVLHVGVFSPIPGPGTWAGGLPNTIEANKREPDHRNMFFSLVVKMHGVALPETIDKPFAVLFHLTRTTSTPLLFSKVVGRPPPCVFGLGIGETNPGEST